MKNRLKPKDFMINFQIIFQDNINNLPMFIFAALNLFLDFFLIFKDDYSKISLSLSVCRYLQTVRNNLILSLILLILDPPDLSAFHVRFFAKW